MLGDPIPIYMYMAKINFKGDIQNMQLRNYSYGEYTIYYYIAQYNIMHVVSALSLFLGPSYSQIHRHACAWLNS